MAYHGINFRASAGFTTDGAGETYSLGEAYPTTRGSKTFGFSASITGDARDRNSSLDRRLVGGCQRANSLSIVKFLWDLPEGAGTYNLRLALGDPNNPQNHRCLIRDGDGGTILATINDDTGNGGDISWLDATGVERIGSPGVGAYWPTSNAALEVTLTGTQLCLDLGAHVSGAGSTFLAHVSLEFVNTAATLDLEAGSYSISGQAVGTLATRLLGLDSGSYSINGQEVTLTYAQPGVYTLAIDAGAYTINGVEAYRIISKTLDAGAYSISGQDVTFTVTEPESYVLTCDGGSYLVLGRNAFLLGPGDTIPVAKGNQTISVRVGLSL